MAQADFDLQGHRGCRGLMPENTMPAFLMAVELGVSTLELDVVVSKDGEIVVSHEPWMSHLICSHPDGSPVTKSEEKGLNLYHMNYSEIQTYDCGMRFHSDFPYQKKMKAVKPTLKIVVRSIDKFAHDKIYPAPNYNIEIKSDARRYGTYHPDPKTFVRMVVDEIRRLRVEERTTLQSFDLQVLEELHRVQNRLFSISYLVERGKNIEKNLSRLSFTPDVYSPKASLVTPATVSMAHARNVRVIPWTVNDRNEMDKLRLWGCDGGITDYPDIMRMTH